MENPGQPEKKEKGAVKRSSAKKRQIQNEKKRVANKTIRSCIKTKVKAFRESAPTQSLGTNEESLREIYSLADKAAKKNVFSRNKASRIKSRLAKRMRKDSSAN
jgi:small subunit ribosomal protein S20